MTETPTLELVREYSSKSTSGGATDVDGIMMRYGISSSSSRTYSSGLTRGALDFEIEKKTSLSTYGSGLTGSGSYNSTSYTVGGPLVTRDYQVIGSGSDATDTADLLSSKKYSYSTYCSTTSGGVSDLDLVGSYSAISSSRSGKDGGSLTLVKKERSSEDSSGSSEVTTKKTSSLYSTEGPAIIEINRSSGGSGAYSASSAARTVTPGGTRIVREYTSSSSGSAANDTNAGIVGSRGFSSTLITTKKTVTTTGSTE